MRSSAAEPGESPPAQYKTAQPVENGASTGKGRSAKRRALIHHISIQCAIFACCCSRMALRPVPAGAAHGMARAFPKRPIPCRSCDLTEVLHQCTKREYYLARQVLNKKTEITLSKDVVLRSRRAQDAGNGMRRKESGRQIGRAHV